MTASKHFPGAESNDEPRPPSPRGAALAVTIFAERPDGRPTHRRTSRASLKRVVRSVLETLADLVDVVLGHQLCAGIEVRRRYIPVDLQVELHDRVEALQEGLLPERPHQGAGLDLLELLRPEVEAVGADRAVELELRDRIADRGLTPPLRPTDRRRPCGFRSVARSGWRCMSVSDVDADIFRAGVDLEVLQRSAAFSAFTRPGRQRSRGC